MKDIQNRNIFPNLFYFRESDAGSEFSLFEALRESIYSEVATLISQNEARPHFLIELFRELQMLTTDYLRQRALYALQDLVSKYLTEDSLRTAPRPVETSDFAVSLIFTDVVIFRGMQF